jgi:hypothetical protein
MKKIILGLFVFGFLFIGSQVHAADPDLIITDLSWSPETPTQNKSVNWFAMGMTVKNIGDASVVLPENMAARVVMNGVSYGGFSLGTAYYNLNPGDSQFIDFHTTQSPNILENAGTFDITATIDDTQSGYYPEGLVQESNENNNTLTKKITIISDDTSGSGPCIISNFNVSPTIIKAGDPVKINWATSDHCTSVSLNSSDSSFVRLVPNSGNQVVYPKSDSFFDLTASDGTNLVRSSGFSVTLSSEDVTPSITVLSPNGGETYKLGDAPIIRWKTENVPASFKIGIIRLRGYSSNNDGEYDLTSNNTVLNDGSETVFFPSNIPTGNYKLEIKSYVGDVSVFDDSDNVFSIISQAIQTNNGCSNGEVYSSTTGQVCPVIVADNDGCNGATYSITTGKKCPDSMITILGCNGTSNYSSTTGQACPKITPIIDSGCHGTNYSTTTGNKCSDDTVIDGKGCTGGNYSLTTGKQCPQNTIIDRGCTGATYSSTTGSKCPINTIKVDAGCNGTNKYSITTGQACSNVTSTSSSTCASSGLGCGVQANTNNNINIGTSSTVTSASINRTLKVGVTGEDVKVLQRFLKITADGKYGNWTATNLKNWQKANGLYPDGSFGPMSRQKAGLTQ